MLLGFEDLPGGGDRYFNDLVFAVDTGLENTAAMFSASVDDASSTFALRGIGLFAIVVCGLAYIWSKTVENGRNRTGGVGIWVLSGGLDISPFTSCRIASLGVSRFRLFRYRLIHVRVDGLVGAPPPLQTNRV